MIKKQLLLLAVLMLLTGCGTNNKKETQEPDAAGQNKAGLSAVEMQPVEDMIKETDSYITWDEKNIMISELTQEYEIWFLADSHIIVQDGSESEEVAAYAGQRIPGFVNEMGVSSEQIFSQFITQANEQKPDMVLFGGDILDFPSEANISYLKKELDRLKVPYMFAMGNHDWTFPWEYMTQEGSETYRPMFEKYMYGNLTVAEAGEENKITTSVLTAMGNTYANVIELEDMVFLSIDDSSNQVAAEAMDAIEYAYSLEKPIILMQHVPFSTEALITKAKEAWANPVTLGMQVHGGIAPGDISADLWAKTHDDNSLIKAVLAGHVHFAYEEQLSGSTVEIITDAAFKGKATKIVLQPDNKEHVFFCDKFMLTVDDKQYDLTLIDPTMSSVSELLPITNNHLFILGRVDEQNNALLIYDFQKDEFVFSGHGSTMCWIQNDYNSVRYLKENTVYDLNGSIIYEADESKRIHMIEYVDKDFKITITDPDQENPQEVWIKK